MTANRPLLIIGAGGFGRETAALVAHLDGYDLVGFLDDDASIHGSSVSGVQVVGPIEDATNAGALFVVTTGNPRDFGSRRRIVERLGLDEDRYATLVHPSVVVGAGSTIGAGSVVHAGSVLTADVQLGNHVAVMPNVVLTHDDRIGAFTTLAAGVLIAGGVTVGEGAYIGSGVRVREDAKIGSGALIGMGSVVVDDVPPGETWYGVPARRH